MASPLLVSIPSSPAPWSRRRSAPAPALSDTPPPSPASLASRPSLPSLPSGAPSADGLFAHGHARRKRYRAVRTVGVGSEGVVKAAYSLETGLLVALKASTKADLPLPGGGALHESYSTRLRKWEEDVKALRAAADVLASMDHAHILNVFDVFETERKVYVVSELAQGVGDDLLSYLKSVGGRLDENAIRQIMAGVLSGLSYLHFRGIAHRDIKPHNILLRDFADPTSVCLADFTGAHISDPEKECESRNMKTIIGTPFYMAPEQVSGAPYTDKVDAYAAGIVAYQLAFGRNPFEPSSSFEELYGKIREGRWTFPEGEGSSLLRDFILKLMCADPSQRLSARDALAHPFLTCAPDVDKDMSGTLVVYEESSGELRCAATSPVDTRWAKEKLMAEWVEWSHKK
ncbi:kinase-like domain-containing protein [Hyaloraphidium curvatum]|nr:kinase-like domain-containing protein [Hyaloraphidium curvatum]